MKNKEEYRIKKQRLASTEQTNIKSNQKKNLELKNKININRTGDACLFYLPEQKFLKNL